MSLILTTAIEKGGTGKTTTVVNLAALMAAEGKRVLVVDMDQQANTTYMLTQHKKAENFYKGHGLVNMFMNFDLGGMDLTPYIHPTNVEGVHIIPSTAQTPRAVHQLDLLADEYKMKNYTFLIHCLANINDDYDYIVIDTPPARDTLAYNALTAADGVVIPCEPSLYSADGIAPLKDSIDQTKAYTNPRVEIVGLLMTNYEHGTIVSKRMRSAVRDMAECLGTRVFDTPISHTTAVRKSQAAHTDIFTFDAKCSAARDYDAFCGQFLECVGGDGDGR